MLFAKNIALFTAFTLLLFLGQQETLKAQQNISQKVSVTSATQFFDICSNPRLITFSIELQDTILTSDSIFGYEVVVQYDTTQYTFVSVLSSNTLSEGMDVGSNFLDAGVVVLSGAIDNESVFSTREKKTLVAFSLRTKVRCEDTLNVNVIRHTWMYQRNGGLRISPRIVGSSAHTVVGRVAPMPERTLELLWKQDTVVFDSSARQSSIDIYPSGREYQGLSQISGKLVFPNFVRIDSIVAEIASLIITSSEDNTYEYTAFPETFATEQPIATVFLSAAEDTVIREGEILLEIDSINACACVSEIQSSKVLIIDNGIPRKDTSVSVIDNESAHSDNIVIRQKGQILLVNVPQHSMFAQLQCTIYDLQAKEIFNTVLENRGVEVEIAMPTWIQRGVYLVVVSINNSKKSYLYRQY